MTNKTTKTQPRQELWSQTYDSPLGELLIVASDLGLRAILWPLETEATRVKLGDYTEGNNSVITQAVLELDEYFAGTRHDFDVAIDPVGTDFQKSVWTSLRDIGYAKTKSYGEQADQIGKPTAVRAVASANGKNPISIVVPCHRVIGANGSLTGFAGGLDSKRWLLNHELTNAGDAFMN